MLCLVCLAFSLHPQAYKNSKGLDNGPQQFLKDFNDCWPLVLPELETRAIMQLRDGQSFSDCHQDIIKVCNSGALGMACFSFALELTMAETLMKTIEQEVAAFMGHNVITLEVTGILSIWLYVVHHVPPGSAAQPCNAVMGAHSTPRH